MLPRRAKQGEGEGLSTSDPLLSCSERDASLRGLELVLQECTLSLCASSFSYSPCLRRFDLVPSRLALTSQYSWGTESTL